jgi:flavin reductase (DIM6/NTAB) family NADH-FMN oxidoreductase RutF
VTHVDWLTEATTSWENPRVSVGVDVFRSLMGSFPAGVTVVTTIDHDGSPRGMTLNAFMSVSSEPPMLAICIARNSVTLAATRRTGAFAVHVLDEHSVDLSQRFAGKESSFAGLCWSRSEAALGVPVLADGAIAVAECLVETIVSAGDHDLVLGRIVAGRHSANEPLLYHRRRYAGWPTNSSR